MWVCVCVCIPRVGYFRAGDPEGVQFNLDLHINLLKGSGVLVVHKEREWVHGFSWMTLRRSAGAGQKVPLSAAEQRISCWSRYTKHIWVNKSLKVDGAKGVCPTAQRLLKKQVKLRITELCCKHGWFSSLFWLHDRIWECQLCSGKGSLTCTWWHQDGVKTSPVPLREGGSKWKGLAKSLSTPAFSPSSFL